MVTSPSGDRNGGCKGNGYDAEPVERRDPETSDAPGPWSRMQGWAVALPALVAMVGFALVVFFGWRLVIESTEQLEEEDWEHLLGLIDRVDKLALFVLGPVFGVAVEPRKRLKRSPPPIETRAQVPARARHRTHSGQPLADRRATQRVPEAAPPRVRIQWKSEVDGWEDVALAAATPSSPERRPVSDGPPDAARERTPQGAGAVQPPSDEVEVLPAAAGREGETDASLRGGSGERGAGNYPLGGSRQ